MHKSHYDIIIVGAGVAGATLAHALATIRPEKPLRIAMVERSFSEPDRIVGELLQPGGVAALKTLGMSSCTDNIDAVKVSGYLIIEEGEVIRVPYSRDQEGRSFHHGRFIMNLRRTALQNSNVHPIEATVSELIECPQTGHVIGVRAISKPDVAAFNIYGDLVIIADGCFSNFRNIVMGEASCKPTSNSYFVGTILKDLYLPAPEHGTVILPHGYGPVLLYQISPRETRILIDIQHPLPTDFKSHILTKVLPQLPSFIHKPLQESLSKERLRLMPNSFLPSVQQGTPLSKTGVILLGDSWNMRHPLTGGGMTVALNDVLYLRDIFASIKHFDDWEEIRYALSKWYWGRKPLSSTINLLSGTLYGLFRKDNEDYRAIRRGCFRYFQLGGKRITDAVSLLSGVSSSPFILASHFICVIFYAIWVIFTHPRIVKSQYAKEDLRPTYEIPSPNEYPSLVLMGFRMFFEGCCLFLPVLWSEIRWWAPS